MAAGIFVTGCYTMHTASLAPVSYAKVAGARGTPREHVVVSNYGWYLFNTIPIVCGNARGRFPWVFFRNDVTADIVHDHLTNYAAERKAEVAELNFAFNDSMILSLPVAELPVPIPYIISYRERSVSGVLMTPPVPVAPPAPAATGTSVKYSPRPAPAARPAPSTLSPAEAEARKLEINRLLNNIPDGGVK